MNFRPQLLILLLAIYLSACTNFEDAELTKRATFVRFYADNLSFVNPTVEVDLDGGYVIAFNIPKGDDDFDARVIKTDENGNKLWEQNFENSFVQGIHPSENGYLMVGISIQIDREAIQVSENYNTKAFVRELTKEGSISKTFDFNQNTVVNGVTLTIDFKGDALAIDGVGNIILLGSFKRPEAGSFETSIVIALDATNLLPIWTKSYSLLNRDYVNCPSLYRTSNDKLLWASTSSLTVQNNNEAYVSISYVQPNATFENNSKLGENDARNHLVADLRKSTIGYGIIGTYQESNSQNGNIYFSRVDNGGNVIQNSTIYFDGHSESIVLSNRDQSTTEDEGNALIGTLDGGYLLGCTVASTPTKGNGGTDIRLIKLDAFGNLLWTELLGGPGDESVSAIRESADGSLIICGSNSINGLSSILLMKLTDKGSLSD